MTKENCPLIGPMQIEGAFMNCAMSGFGDIASCAAGEIMRKLDSRGSPPLNLAGFR